MQETTEETLSAPTALPPAPSPESLGLQPFSAESPTPESPTPESFAPEYGPEAHADASAAPVELGAPAAPLELGAHAAQTELAPALLQLVARGLTVADIAARLGLDSGAMASLLAEVVAGPEAANPLAFAALSALDLDGVDVGPLLRQHLSTAALELLEERVFAWVSAADRWPRVPAHTDLAGRFAALAEQGEPTPDVDLQEAQRMARAVAWALAARDDYPSRGLALVRSEPSTLLARALARDERLLAQDRWLSALLFHGDGTGRALAATSFIFAGRAAVDRVRYTAALAPVDELGRLAEAYGLLTLVGARAETARTMLRGALLVHVFCGEKLSGIPWWRLFRGECALADSLPELGSSRDSLARELATGLPQRLGDRGLRDPGVRDALSLVLADVLSRDPSYSAAMRLSEAQLRDWRRGADEAAEGDALPDVQRADAIRDYAWLLVGAARRLLDYGKRPTADLLYRRVVKLRQENSDVLVADLFPDRLEKALDVSSPAGLARRLRLDEEGRPATGDAALAASLGGQRPSPEDPLPGTTDIVAAVTGVAPLPMTMAVWAEAVPWTKGRLLDALIPLPFRRLATRALHVLGCTPKARLVLAASGAGALDVTYRLFGLPLSRYSASLPAHRVFVFPTESPRADRLLGRWAAILLALSTIGTWLFLRATDDVGQLTGALTVGGALIAYAGALSLHRVVGAGLAMALFDERGKTTVWSLRPEERALLVSYAERTEAVTAAQLSAPL